MVSEFSFGEYGNKQTSESPHFPFTSIWNTNFGYLILNACYVFMCVGLISSIAHGLGPQVRTIFFDWLSLYEC